MGNRKEAENRVKRKRKKVKKKRPGDYLLHKAVLSGWS